VEGLLVSLAEQHPLIAQRNQQHGRLEFSLKECLGYLHEVAVLQWVGCARIIHHFFANSKASLRLGVISESPFSFRLWTGFGSMLSQTPPRMAEVLQTVQKALCDDAFAIVHLR